MSYELLPAVISSPHSVDDTNARAESRPKLAQYC